MVLAGWLRAATTTTTMGTVNASKEGEEGEKTTGGEVALGKSDDLSAALGNWHLVYPLFERLGCEEIVTRWG